MHLIIAYIIIGFIFASYLYILTDKIGSKEDKDIVCNNKGFFILFSLWIIIFIFIGFYLFKRQKNGDSRK